MSKAEDESELELPEDDLDDELFEDDLEDFFLEEEDEDAPPLNPPPPEPAAKALPSKNAGSPGNEGFPFPRDFVNP